MTAASTASRPAFARERSARSPRKIGPTASSTLRVTASSALARTQHPCRSRRSRRTSESAFAPRKPNALWFILRRRSVWMYAYVPSRTLRRGARAVARATKPSSSIPLSVRSRCSIVSSERHDPSRCSWSWSAAAMAAAPSFPIAFPASLSVVSCTQYAEAPVKSLSGDMTRLMSLAPSTSICEPVTSIKPPLPPSATAARSKTHSPSLRRSGWSASTRSAPESASRVQYVTMTLDARSRTAMSSLRCSFRIFSRKRSISPKLCIGNGTRFMSARSASTTSSESLCKRRPRWCMHSRSMLASALVTKASSSCSCVHASSMKPWLTNSSRLDGTLNSGNGRRLMASKCRLKCPSAATTGRCELRCMSSSDCIARRRWMCADLNLPRTSSSVPSERLHESRHGITMHEPSTRSSPMTWRPVSGANKTSRSPGA
mmetsp:Transcript_7566/g.25106  ORF Transcript_7566/g.25106 Transcript_7566/m.25106 type:complete len:431 (-) Transcript_7566:326-1618(-)